MVPAEAAPQSSILALILGIIAVLSFFINVFQFLSNRSKDRRLKKYEKFDYEAHLQLIDEEVHILREAFGHALSYSAKIENCSSKPVQIKNILLEYGSDENIDKRYKFQVEREFYLKADERKGIHQSLMSDEIEKAMTQFGLKDCHFSLRVTYIDASSTIKQKELPLVTTGSSGTMFDVRSGIIA